MHVNFLCNAKDCHENTLHHSQKSENIFIELLHFNTEKYIDMIQITNKFCRYLLTPS